MKKIVVLQLVLFVITALTVVPYGIYYIVGPTGVGDRINIHATVDNALGVGEGTVVTYRGVQAGMVTGIGFDPETRGARIDFALDGDTRIPVDSYAKITQGTMAGMLNVDIFPRVDHGPYLSDGDEIAMPADEQPTQISETLAHTADLLETIDPAVISTVGQELGSAFEGLGPDLARLVTDADRLSAQLAEDAPAVAELLDRAAGLTGTMAENSSEFVDGMASARTVAESLQANEDRIASMMATGPDAMRRADEAIGANQESFSAVLANLGAVGPVISDRSAALRTGLDAIPRGLAALESIVHGDRANFALIATQGPACYYDNPRRALGDTSPIEPNLDYYCPPGQDLEQRGSRNAPRPNDLGLGGTTPGTVIGPPVVADPILIPSGTELLYFWKSLLEGNIHGTR